MTDWREKFASEMGLPLSARFQHAEEEIREAAAQIKLQHPTHTPDMARGRAMARLDARKHQRSQAKSFIVTKDHNWRRKVEVAAFILMFLFCLVMATRAHGQSTTIQGRAKGATAANTATVTSVDANHNAIDVNIASGGGSGGTASNFGAAFPATGTAAGFSDGTNMLPGTLDASGFLKINCAAGCVAGGSFTDASAFTFGTTAVSNTAFVVDDVATNTVAENSSGAARMNTNRILYMDISKTAANTIAIKVDGSAVTQPVSLTSTTITGTVAVTQSTSPWVISFTAPQHVIIDSGTTAATQSGTWNIRIQDGAGNALTTNSTTYTAKFALDGNLLGTLGTAFTTPGFVDIKGADGNVFVRQATGTNLHMVCDSGCGGAASFADSSAFTFATTSVNNISAVVDDVATNTVAENSAGAVRMNTNRILYVDLSKTAANTNKLLVTPDSVALPANQSVNVNQLAGTTTDTNSGVKSAGTLRVVLATDQPALTNKLLVTPDSVALPANQSVNVSQINAVTPLMGNGVTGTGSPRVTLASDGTAISTTGYMSVKIDQTTPGTTNGVRSDASGATGAAPPARAELNGYIGSGATGGFTTGAAVGDTYKNINVSTATTTLLVTGVSGRQVRISAMHMITAAANNVALIEGTGATCGTGSAGMAGGTTAASGYNFAANGGIAFGSGLGTVMQTATTGDSVCVVTSAATQLSGGLQYTIY
jgi:hypothetical protein